MSLSFVASPVTLITASNKTRFRNPTSFLNKIVSRRSLPQRPSKLAPSKFFGHRLRFEIIPCAYTCALKVCAKHVTTSDDEWSVSLADDDLEDEESDRESDDDVSKEMWHRIKEAFESPVLNSDVLDEKEVLTKVSTSNMVLERGELMNSTWMPGDLKSFQRSCTLKDLDLGAMGEAGAVEVNMDVQQIEEADWYVTADIVADTKLRCDRCGCHFRRKTTGTFAVWVTCDQELSKFNDVGDGDECDGVLVLTSRMTGVDLGQVVRDTISLAIPLQNICSSKCKGLCQYCGANLNVGLCKCEGPPLPSSQLAELGAILNLPDSIDLAEFSKSQKQRKKNKKSSPFKL